jgi:hypothetical protein
VWRGLGLNLGVIVLAVKSTPQPPILPVCSY